MHKIGIIGAGKIADSHMIQISGLKECEVTAVCDREILLAEQLAERFSINKISADSSDIIQDPQIDSIHITTPPGSHFDLAKASIHAGKNVYIEKPMTLYANETEDLLNLAEKKKVLLTVGHNVQFSPPMIQMRNLVNNNYLGGPPLHMESSYFYDLSDRRYARSFFSKKDHWVRRLPGGLLQNIISHGIGKISEFLNTVDPEVHAFAHQSPLLKELKEKNLYDELRVIIVDGNVTAYYTFSTQVRPVLHQFILLGKDNSIFVDDDKSLTIPIPGTKLKSYLEMTRKPHMIGKAYRKLAQKNLIALFRKDLSMGSGMYNLIKSFYSSIDTKGLPPIPYDEILRTYRIMDSIFDQINHKENHFL
jgi:predicted dehydrogenase